MPAVAPFYLAGGSAIALHLGHRTSVYLDFFTPQGDYDKLDDLLQRMPDKFPNVTYPSYPLLRALAYFEDAEPDPMPPMPTPLEWPTVRRFFEDEVRRLMRALLGPSS
ncbi:MAG TPA: hypothetical protein EYH32_00930 [Anaerolineae bacterium]|nr:hypothetical protein [Anaerolineae bacterium]